MPIAGGFNAGLHWMLGGAQLGNLHKTYMGSIFKLCVGTALGLHGLECGL